MAAFCTDTHTTEQTERSSPALLRNASISMNAETVGEHTVKFEDKALREGIVHMLKGNSSKPVWVAVSRHNQMFFTWLYYYCLSSSGVEMQFPYLLEMLMLESSFFKSNKCASDGNN